MLFVLALLPLLAIVGAFPVDPDLAQIGQERLYDRLYGFRSAVFFRLSHQNQCNMIYAIEKIQHNFTPPLIEYRPLDVDRYGVIRVRTLPFPERRVGVIRVGGVRIGELSYGVLIVKNHKRASFCRQTRRLGLKSVSRLIRDGPVYSRCLLEVGSRLKCV
ncbi:hypothetical protein Y032_0014g2390 [Ancylostoma ceylanicum]|uniref:Uncharacterized protein n=1 Tax=Ancylostoma ceylanicum TaxID=53326 RepID=A0A016VBX5_9BILA|nr:hypothetical protein Y032_0014g2390 [Ancylostoma ceylanicum]